MPPVPRRRPRRDPAAIPVSFDYNRNLQDCITRYYDEDDINDQLTHEHGLILVTVCRFLVIPTTNGGRGYKATTILKAIDSRRDGLSADGSIIRALNRLISEETNSFSNRVFKTIWNHFIYNDPHLYVTHAHAFYKQRMPNIADDAVLQPHLGIDSNPSVLSRSEAIKRFLESLIIFYRLTPADLLKVKLRLSGEFTLYKEAVQPRRNHDIVRSSLTIHETGAVLELQGEQDRSEAIPSQETGTPEPLFVRDVEYDGVVICKDETYMLVFREIPFNAAKIIFLTDIIDANTANGTIQQMHGYSIETTTSSKRASRSPIVLERRKTHRDVCDRRTEIPEWVRERIDQFWAYGERP